MCPSAISYDSTFQELADQLNPGYFYAGTVYFTSTGDFTKATYPWLRAVKVDVVGGGGAGAGTAATGAGEMALGAGGSSGGRSIGWHLATALGATETATVGAGGVAGTGDGGTGGNSSFGTLVTAMGGPGGLTLAPTTDSPNFVGSNAIASAGTGNMLALRGNPGGVAHGVAGARVISGSGALSPIGAGAPRGRKAAVTGWDGVTAEAYGPGAGGSGACSLGNQAAREGGTGASGIVIVELYA